MLMSKEPIDPASNPLDAACRHSAIGRTAGILILLVPIIGLSVFGYPFVSSETRALGRKLLSEGHVVEWIGFFGFMLGGIAGVNLSKRLKRAHELRWVSLTYLICGLAFMFLAMEEISWGQRVFGFSTPALMESINLQKETNVHNLPIIQDLNEWFLIACGVFGFAMTWLARHARLWRIAVPPILGPWFLLIALWVSVDIGPWHHWLPEQMDYAVGYLIEMIEALLGWSCLLYVVLNARTLQARRSVRV